MRTTVLLTDTEQNGSIPIKCDVYTHNDKTVIQYPDKETEKGWKMEVENEILRCLLADDDLK